MALRGDRNQKALGRPLAHPQRDGLGDDRRHRQRLKHRLESAAHLAADAQQRIVIIVAERRPATAPKVGLETRRNDQIAVNFLTLRRRPGRLLVGVMSAHAESRRGLDGARDAARRGRPVQIDHADRNALHLARAEDRRHEQNAEQRQRDAHAEIEPAGNHPPENSRLSTAVKPVFRLLSIRYGCSLRLTSTDMPGRRPSTAGSGLAFRARRCASRSCPPVWSSARWHSCPAG